jgi:hypothetical protein
VFLETRTLAGCRTTPARKLILRAKKWYKSMSKNYVNDDEGRFNATMKKYFEELNVAYPGHNWNEYPGRNWNDWNEQPFLILCSDKAKGSNRVKYENTHTYKEGVSPKYGIAKYPDAVNFSFKSRDAPTHRQTLLKCRHEIDKVSPQVASSSMDRFYAEQLKQCERAKRTAQLRFLRLHFCVSAPIKLNQNASSVFNE